MNALVKWWNTHTLSVRGLPRDVRTAVAVTVVLVLAGYAFTVATWGRAPVVEQNDWAPTAITQPQLSRLAALMALLGFAAGAAMLTAASAGIGPRMGRLIRIGVFAAGISYGGLHAVMCTGLVWEPPGAYPAYAVFALAAWAAVAVVPIALNAKAASRWSGPAAAAAPYAAGILVTVSELAFPRIGFAWSVIALQPFTLLAIGGVGLLLAFLAAQGAFAAVETGRWAAAKTIRFPWLTTVVIGLAAAAGIWWVIWWTDFHKIFWALLYTIFLAFLSIAVLRVAHRVDVRDSVQTRWALVLATLFFAPILALPAIGAPLVGVPALVSRPGPLAAVAVLLLGWRLTRRFKGRALFVVRPALITVATATAMLLERFVPLDVSKAMADPVNSTMSDVMGVLRKIFMLGFSEPFRAGLVYVAVVSVLLLPWWRTRPMGWAGLFLVAWNLPWWFGFTVSARHFAVFAAVLLTVLLVARWISGATLRIETITIVLAVWVFAVVAWVSHAADLVPDGWSRWAMPLALVTPVLIPLLLQAQSLNTGALRRERILITCGIGVAAAGLVLFFTVMGLWREDLPWGTLAGIFLTMPFGVIAVASASVPDTLGDRIVFGPAEPAMVVGETVSGAVRPRTESVPEHA